MDLADFAFLAQYWITDDWRGDFNDDGVVDNLDLAEFADQWLWSVDQ